MAGGGRWGGAQVVPTDWVARSLATHVPSGWGTAPTGRAGYGYLWFTAKLSGHDAAWAWGYGAQLAVAVPSLRLAIATTAVEPHPSQLVAQNNAVMGVVARIVALAG